MSVSMNTLPIMLEDVDHSLLKLICDILCLKIFGFIFPVVMELVGDHCKIPVTEFGRLFLIILIIFYFICITEYLRNGRH